MSKGQPASKRCWLAKRMIRSDLEHAADGQVIGDGHGILGRWQEYVVELLQRDTQGTDDGVGNVVGEPQEEDEIRYEDVC